ncbi:hypothetical protein HKD37_02G004940 [Glycine soja]
MSKSAKEEIVIIDSIAASDYQVTMIGLQFKGKEGEAHYLQSQGRPQQNFQGNYQGYRGGSGSNQPYGWRQQNNNAYSGPTKPSFVGQLEKQLSKHGSGSFLANTQVNPKEQCKAITTRKGNVVGLKDNGEK